MDAVYHKRVGRRKSWLVPVQMLCGIMMLIGAGHIDEWMGEGGSEGDGSDGGVGGGGDGGVGGLRSRRILGGLRGRLGSDNGDGDSAGGTPDVSTLTLFFFVLYLLMATQDIAVDGWALTMLSRANVSYASTCNSVGQTVGYFIAYIGFLTLNDPGTCDKYFRSVPDPTRGMVSLAGFLQFFGYVFVVTTIYIWLFKSEKPEADQQDAVRDDRVRTS